MRLLPRKNSFFDMFDQHADHLVKMADELSEMLGKFDNLEERQQRIKDLEHRCDRITHDLARELHATFVTPLDKEDISAIYSGLDDVADYIDAAASRLILYQIPESSPESRELAALLVQCIGVLRDAISCMRTGSKDNDRIMGACRDLHRLENESDAVYRRALAALFNTPGIDPIVVLKWKEIYERLEMAVDKVEDVTNVLEAVQLKYA